jgi:glucoamylase
MLRQDPLPYLATMARMTGPGGLIPEQVWDGPSIPSRGLEPGKPTGSAMPLVWAHAEFLKLLVARQRKRPLELLASVEEYLRLKETKNDTWHWRPDLTFDVVPAGRDVLVDMPAPFVLHLGFDGWQSLEDRPSTPLAFGRHGVRLAAKDFDGRLVADFTIYLVDTAQWEGRDHHVRLAQPGV